jgi:hypothetical protein
MEPSVTLNPFLRASYVVLSGVFSLGAHRASTLDPSRSSAITGAAARSSLDIDVSLPSTEFAT